MIDPLTEEVVSLADAAKSLPARRGGKRPHISCVYRWTTSGCKGVILESLQVGGTRCTSREALARFFEGLTYSQSSSDDTEQAGADVFEAKPEEIRTDSPGTPARRRRAAEAAERELERQGL